MKTSIEITESISETLKKVGCKLSEDQEAALHGCMAIWVDHIKENQDKITRHACAENATKIKANILEDVFTDNGHVSLKDKIHQAIINTKAL